MSTIYRLFAPQGRPTVARGAAPGNVSIKFEEPRKGRSNVRELFIPPLQGFRRIWGSLPGATPLATFAGSYGATINATETLGSSKRIPTLQGQGVADFNHTMRYRSPLRPLSYLKNYFILISVLALNLCFAGCSPSTPSGQSSDGAKKTSSENSTGSDRGTVPDADMGASQVTLHTLDDQGVRALVESKQGKVVVMDVWSTSCPPCVAEFPSLVKLSRKYPERLACISLSLDYEGVGQPDDPEVKEPVLEFLRQQQATFDNVLSSVESEEMLKRLGVPAPPAVFVYDEQGELRKTFDDSDGEGFTYEQVEAFVRELLGQSGK